jgi:RNA polymerase sigma-70 factor (ECF subfamily)
MPFSGRRRWLTTVVARICLNALRARRSRAEEPLEAYVPEPLVSAESGVDPEYETLLADALGLALQVVLETLEPAERLAYVLHDMFAVPFEEIARMVERSPAATRQLASRARRRVQGAPTAPDPDLARQRAVVDAFFAAQRSRADAFEDRAFRALGDRRRLRRQARPDIKGGLDARAIASVALRASRASGRDGPYHASGLCTQRHQFAYTARDRRMRPHAAGTAEGMTPGGLPDARTAYPRSHRRHG